MDRKPVYFYCWPKGPPERSAYQHDIVCIAEGLRELGVPFHASTNYWQLRPNREETLLVHSPEVRPEDCQAVVMSNLWFEDGGEFPPNLFRRGRDYVTVYCDLSDGIRTRAWDRAFRRFDVVLKAHCNRLTAYPSNFRPWAFGLSNRILEATDPVPPFAERARSLLVNYRHLHPTRKLAKMRFLNRIQSVLPINESFEEFDSFTGVTAHDRLLWEQSGRRHHPPYYRKLRESAACACFGGLLLPLEPSDHQKAKKAAYRLARGFGFLKPRAVQWDSWRFWESLSAGCVAFHVDFDKYEVSLPVMPENWKHYIGIDLDDVAPAVTRLSEDPNVLAQVSDEGRVWARANYGPVAAARRFLDVVSCAR